MSDLAAANVAVEIISHAYAKFLNYVPHLEEPEEEVLFTVPLSYCLGVESTNGAVEVRNSGISVAGGFRPFQCLNPSQLPVSSSRSSNRACRFPALGFQTKSCLRPRKTPRFRCKSSQTPLFIKSLIGKSHILPASTSTQVLPSL